MKNILSILLMIGAASFVSCKPKAHANRAAATTDSAVYSIIKKFYPTYSGDRSADSNSLIFYGERPFDTSFLLHIKKDIDKVNGTYFEVLPEYHRFLKDVRSSEMQILFFEGYSFIFDSAMWEKIIIRSEKLLPTDTSLKSNPLVRDESHYALILNSRVRKSNFNTSVQYEEFYKFLKDSLLSDLVNKRIPIMHKAK
ncbi:MAG TPA: hypothetical protein PLQ32_02870 [Flavihumibacter sp.]|nr:hypothetical protein [Flavihumibacter sp.]HPZ87018.1 hypothetical protein [Flavihumibacter sp.]HQD09033.1 hypothetical protein [Flavihumibacter sp.]